MTELRFRARGTDGRVAIYTGSDDAPFDNPTANLSRVQFHSDLLYPAIVKEQSGTLNLLSRGPNGEGREAHNLFAHGKSGTPMVIGYATLAGQRVGLCGSVPVQMLPRGWGRWIALGADATNVKIAETWFAQNDAAFSSISIPWTAYVFDVSF